MAAEPQPQPQPQGSGEDSGGESVSAAARLAAPVPEFVPPLRGSGDELSAQESAPGSGGHDLICDRLLRSLDLLHADYEATIAAERRAGPQQDVEQHAPEGPDGNHSSAASARAVGGQDGTEEEDEEQGGEDDPAPMEGYVMLGSDNESGPCDSDEEDSAATGDAAVTLGGGCPVANGPEPAGELVPAAPEWPDDPDFADFQEGGTLENFANFDRTANPAIPELPPPPRFPSLSDQDLHMIQETMKQVEITPPPWAKAMSDRELQRRVKELLRST